MIVKVNVAVRPITYRGSFVIKLVEVDMFKDENDSLRDFIQKHLTSDPNVRNAQTHLIFGHTR